MIAKRSQSVPTRSPDRHCRAGNCCSGAAAFGPGLGPVRGNRAASRVGSAGRSGAVEPVRVGAWHRGPAGKQLDMAGGGGAPACQLPLTGRHPQAQFGIRAFEQKLLFATPDGPQRHEARPGLAAGGLGRAAFPVDRLTLKAWLAPACGPALSRPASLRGQEIGFRATPARPPGPVAFGAEQERLELPADRDRARPGPPASHPVAVGQAGRSSALASAAPGRWHPVLASRCRELTRSPSRPAGRFAEAGRRMQSSRGWLWGPGDPADLAEIGLQGPPPGRRRPRLAPSRAISNRTAAGASAALIGFLQRAWIRPSVPSGI